MFQETAVSEQSDLYAVGVMAYELFADKLPFYSGDAEKMVQAILSGKQVFEETDDDDDE